MRYAIIVAAEFLALVRVTNCFFSHIIENLKHTILNTDIKQIPKEETVPQIIIMNDELILTMYVHMISYIVKRYLYANSFLITIKGVV